MTNDLNTSWEYWTPDDIIISYPPPEQNPMQMVEEFRLRMKQDKNPIMQFKLVAEEFDEWLLECNLNYDQSLDAQELKELADLVYVAFGYANSMGWDLWEALKRVHKNNMDRCVQDDGSIQYREDGKVLKNPNAKKVDLGDLV